MAVEALASARKKTVKKALKGVNYAPTKARWLIQVAQIIKEKFGGKVPADKDSLLSLPGVGPKCMAVVMEEAFGEVVSIPTDSHMFYIFRLLQWVDCEDTKAELVSERIMSWLPEQHWKGLNPIVSGLGQLLKRNKLEVLKAAKNLGPETFKLVQRLSHLYKGKTNSTKISVSQIARQVGELSKLPLSAQYEKLAKGPAVFKNCFGSFLAASDIGEGGVVRRSARVAILNAVDAPQEESFGSDSVPSATTEGGKQQLVEPLIGVRVTRASHKALLIKPVEAAEVSFDSLGAATFSIKGAQEELRRSSRIANRT